MAIERQKLNTLNKLIEHGMNTERKITAMDIHAILAVPKITVPEIHIITELQEAIKGRKVISYLASAEEEGKDEITVTQEDNETEEDIYEERFY